jgi:hypothetical protein
MARRAAQARADVEDPAGGRGPQPCCQLFRRLPAADVELVDGREIGRRQMVEVLARSAQAIADGRDQARAGVVLLDPVAGRRRR